LVPLGRRFALTSKRANISPFHHLVAPHWYEVPDQKQINYSPFVGPLTLIRSHSFARWHVEGFLFSFSLAQCWAIFC
jgi:hypothetical protein